MVAIEKRTLIGGAVATVGLVSALAVWQRFRANAHTKVAVAQSIEHRNEGNALYKKEQLDGALTQYLRALESLEALSSSSSAAVIDAREKAELNCAAVYLDQGRFTDAVRACTAILTKTANRDVRAKALYRRARAYCEQGKLAEAVCNVEEALTVKPGDRQLQELLEDFKKRQQGGN